MAQGRKARWCIHSRPRSPWLSPLHGAEGREVLLGMVIKSPELWIRYSARPTRRPLHVFHEALLIRCRCGWKASRWRGRTGGTGCWKGEGIVQPPSLPQQRASVEASCSTSSSPARLDLRRRARELLLEAQREGDVEQHHYLHLLNFLGGDRRRMARSAPRPFYLPLSIRRLWRSYVPQDPLTAKSRTRHPRSAPLRPISLQQ